MFSVVTCSKDGRYEKLKDSLESNCGLCLQPRVQQLQYGELLCTTNPASIAKGYNCSAEWAMSDVLLFTHVDVEILASSSMLRKAVELVRQPTTGVIGVAGTRNLTAEGYWWADQKAQSGGCMHTDGKITWPSAFGPFGQVVALDGVLLMMRRDLFRKLKGFDERYPGFDFYDVDISLRAKLHGYRNYTFPLQLIHGSVGDVTNKPQWHKNRDMFVAKYGLLLPIGLENRQSVPEKMLSVGV